MKGKFGIQLHNFPIFQSLLGCVSIKSGFGTETKEGPPVGCGFVFACPKAEKYEQNQWAQSRGSL